MIKLLESLRHWGSGGFDRALKRELEHLPANTLPLADCTSRGGYIDDSNLAVTVTSTTEDPVSIQVRVGIFFTEIITGCGCGDDPIPENAYCEMQVSIDKTSGEARFEVIQD